MLLIPVMAKRILRDPDSLSPHHYIGLWMAYQPEYPDKNHGFSLPIKDVPGIVADSDTFDQEGIGEDGQPEIRAVQQLSWRLDLRSDYGPGFFAIDSCWRDPESGGIMVGAADFGSDYLKNLLDLGYGIVSDSWIHWRSNG